MKAVQRLLLVLGGVALVAGCSTFEQRDQMASFNAAYISGDYQTALQAVSPQVDESHRGDTESNVLERLHQGEMYLLTGQYSKAVSAYDLAEDGMKHLDTEGVLQKAADGFMAVMVNDSVRDYKVLMSEAVLVNTYKGLAFLAEGNQAYARVEFNRANDRTRRAVDYFHKEISEQQAALRKEARDGDSNAAAVRNSLGSEGLQAAVTNHYGAVSGWSVFPQFIVPASTYLYGLYFLANASDGSDAERAATALKRVADMQPESTVLKADAELAVNLAAGKQKLSDLPPQVWVMYENGLGPVLEESRFSVPILITQGHQLVTGYFGIALPKYTERSAVPGTLGVVDSAGDAKHTERISDMGRVVRTEMKERFAGILTRAVTSAVIKAALQREATKQFGLVGQIGAFAFAAATTQADLRSWQALPDHWQAARINRPESGILTLSGSNGEALGQVEIPQQPFTLVYVKRPALSAPATVITIDLQGKTKATLTRLPEQPAARVSKGQ